MSPMISKTSKDVTSSLNNLTKKKSLFNRYPFVVSEIFEYDIPPMLNAFFQICLTFTFNPIPNLYNQNTTAESKQMTLLEYMFSFLDNRMELNSTLSAYFQKAVYGLYFFRTQDVCFIDIFIDLNVFLNRLSIISIQKNNICRISSFIFQIDLSVRFY